MEFKDIVMKRYAAKKFDGKKIPKDKVEELKTLIQFSASSFNIQSWKIKVIEDQEMKEKLKPASFNQEQITSCSHLLVFCADTDLMGLIAQLKKQMLENGAKEEEIKGYIDMMIGYVKNLTEEQKLAYAKEQVHIALGNSINGSKALGFDSCPMGGFSPDEYSKILDLPKNIIPTVLCPIGYASDEPRPKMRFEKKNIFF